MKKLAGVLLAAVLATLPAQALEPVIQPLADSGYTYYAIDSHGELYAWGDSFHGAVGPTDQDPLPWEEANILLENARYVAAGFIMAAAIDTEGVLWGWGATRAGLSERGSPTGFWRMWRRSLWEIPAARRCVPTVLRGSGGPDTENRWRCTGRIPFSGLPRCWIM